jgi:hypothetical protein
VALHWLSCWFKVKNKLVAPFQPCAGQGPHVFCSRFQRNLRSGLRLSGTILLLLGVAFVSACKETNPVGRSQPAPVVEAGPAVTATADVDRRATLVLKQDLVTRFPQNSPGSEVEAGLTKDGF